MTPETELVLSEALRTNSDVVKITIDDVLNVYLKDGIVMRSNVYKDDHDKTWRAVEKNLKKYIKEPNQVQAITKCVSSNWNLIKNGSVDADIPLLEIENPIEESENGNADDIKEEEKEIPKIVEEDIKFVLDTICKEAKYDRPAVKQLFYALLSGMTQLPIHHKVNSKDSGAGKSYVTKTVANYFPTDRLMIIAGITDKAFFYLRGRLAKKR